MWQRSRNCAFTIGADLLVMGRVGAAAIMFGSTAKQIAIVRIRARSYGGYPRLEVGTVIIPCRAGDQVAVARLPAVLYPLDPERIASAKSCD